MNQTKVIEVKKYLFRHLESHLADKTAQKVADITRAVQADLKTLEKLTATARKAVDATVQAREALVKKVKSINEKASLNGNHVYRDSNNSIEVQINTRSKTFATIGSREYYYCEEDMFPIAKQAVADIEKFCLGLLLDGTMDDVEAFKTSLLRSI